MAKEITPNEIEKNIINSIRELKYGAVEVIVHDSKVVQVEKSEKIRFDKNN